MNYIFATVQWLFWCWILGAVLFAGGDLIHSAEVPLKKADIWLIAGWFLSILVGALFFVTMGLATGPDQ